MNIGEYHQLFTGLFYDHLKKIVNKPEKIKLISEESIKIKILFKNGAIFQASEDWLLKNNELSKMESYSYQYITSDGYFFRYDKEGEIEGAEKKSLIELLKKPVCHIHIGIPKDNFNIDKHNIFLKEGKGPHFKTHNVNIVDVLGTILTNFYKDDYEDEDNEDKLGKCLDKIQIPHQKG